MAKTKETEADLDLFCEEASSLILTDEQLLAIHGGSCLGPYYPPPPPPPPPLAPCPYGP